MNRKLGDQGEEIAARYLLERGYKILDRNFHTRYGELDIICKEKKAIVFVEVKTRRSTKYGFPEEAVTRKKIEHLKKAALIYLSSNNGFFKEMRFDVITVLMNNEGQKLNHIKNAF